MVKKWKGPLMLLTATLFWGLAFVTQTTAMDHVGPFTFQAVRQMIGFLVLLPVISWRDRHGQSVTPDRKTRKTTLLYSAICGFILFVACSFQQFGLYFGVSTGKSAFLTALYIIFVPICGIFLRKRVPLHVWIAAVCAVGGLYFLCGSDGLKLGLGEFLTIQCALCFTGHILYIDFATRRVDCVRFAAWQFFFCSLYSVPFAIATESISLSAIAAAWVPIAYTGIFSSAVAYTLQIIAQKDTEPAVASLVMSLESVFSSLFGWLILGQTLSVTELFGCAVMFGAILLAQLPKNRA